MVSTDPTESPAWDSTLLRNPHAVADKRMRVRKMFAAIASSYDLNNRLHSLWMDQSWRRRAVRSAAPSAGERIVDVACGTGDLTLCFARALRALQQGRLSPNQLIGLDFTYEMLPIARGKATACAPSSAPEPSSVRFVNGDALSLPLADASVDVVSIAFGIRNVSDPAAALREFRRVLRPGGRVVIVEFSLPGNPLLRGLYNFYFRQVLPRTATFISGDRTGAYRYLPESVNTFIGRDMMLQLMRDAGFESPTQMPMTFGVCVCYRGAAPTRI